MDPENYGRVSSLTCRALAGVEAGILGGLAMLGWLALNSAFNSQSIWLLPNILGSTFRGGLVLERGFSWTTVSGLGLHLAASGLIGMGFGLLAGPQWRRLRVTLFGMVTGLVWFYFSQLLLWRKLGAVALIYSHPRPLLLAHLVFGLMLGRLPDGLRSVERFFGREAQPAEMPETNRAPGAVE